MEKETIVISLSLDNIIEGIYALSALRNHTGAQPVLMERSNAPALRRHLRDLCAQMLASLGTWVINSNIDSEDPDPIMVEFRQIPCPAALLLTRMEGALTAEIMTSAYGTGTPGEAIKGVSEIFDTYTPTPLPRIKRA